MSYWLECVYWYDREIVFIFLTQDLRLNLFFFLFNVKFGPCLKEDSRNNLCTIYMYTFY